MSELFRGIAGRSGDMGSYCDLRAIELRKRASSDESVDSWDWSCSS